MKKTLLLLSALALVLTGCGSSKTSGNKEEVKYSRKPIVDTETNTVKFGLYPQTHVSDESLLAELNALGSSSVDDVGWYKYNGDYYAWIYAVPQSLSYTFDNGDKIEDQAKYWFKCEPITWNILSKDNNIYYLVSSVLLDARRFYSSEEQRMVNGIAVYANNYEYSEIRSWLNDLDGSSYNGGNYVKRGFKTLAFGKMEDGHLQASSIDNSLSSTDGNQNRYTCNNTYDSVFLVSYQDFLDTNYGFSDLMDSETRCCKTTDYARAARAVVNTSDGYQNNGNYWTRSPYSIDYSNAWGIDSYGSLKSYNNVTDRTVCLRPAITLKIS